MADSVLAAFWITPLCRHGPVGYGVTAWSLDDALQIIRGWGYELPEDLHQLSVREGVTFTDLDNPYVIDHMGPIAVRGVWYPFVGLGVPRWMYL